MKRLIASFAALGMLATPVVATATTKADAKITKSQKKAAKVAAKRQTAAAKVAAKAK
jgi:hypothetical protein